MVFILTEDKAQKVFENYREVAAFALGDSKKYDSAKITVSYKKCALLPDSDTINAVLAGDISAKKVIKKAVKGFVSNKEEYLNVSMTMAHLVKIIADPFDVPKGASRKYLKKHGPNIIVFVLDGVDEKKDKFLTKYIQALFGAYGIDCLTGKDKKVIKKLFNKKKKAVKNVYEFIRNNKSKVLPNKQGRLLMKVGQAYFGAEILQQAITADKDERAIKIDERTAKKLSIALTDMLSGTKIMELEDAGMKDEKLMKSMSKKFKKLAKAYNEFRDFMASTEGGIKLPKAKYGLKDKKGLTPRMNIKKFIKFFTKKKNRELLRLVYAHLACACFDMEIGTGDYNKNMSASLSIFGSDFSKQFTAAAKAYRKATEDIAVKAKA